MSPSKRLASAAFVLVLAACSDSPSGPEGGAQVSGFRILAGSSERFEWSEGDNAAADTMFLTGAQSLAVRFVWLGPSGGVVDVSDDAELEVAISNSGAAEWIPDDSEPFEGVFDPGPFPNVETAMRITLVEDGDTLFRSPMLQLHVRTP